MAIKVERMTRDFVFNNIHLPDPNPELPIEKVRPPDLGEVKLIRV